MSFESRAIQWPVWGGLLLVVTIASGWYVRTELARRREAGARQMVVAGHVPAFGLTNQTGRVTTLESLRGQVWLADVIFTRCPGPCLEMTRRMAEIGAALPPGSPIKLISLTTDPDFDQPDILRKYAERFGADADRWQFLTGPKTEIYRVAVEGLKLVVLEKKPSEREIENDLFLHSTVLALVDKQGRLRGQFNLLTDVDEPDSVSAESAAAAEARRDREERERRSAILSAVQTLLKEK